MEQRSERMNSMRMLNALLLAATLVACAHQAWAQQHLHSAPAAVAQAPQTPAPPQTSASPPAAVAHGDTHAPTIFTLRSGIAQGRMVYLGVGGEIDGKVNPMLVVHEGETVQINLINGEGAEHDIVIDQYAARSDRVLAIGASSTLAFTADKTGEFIYFCSIAGHREAGMEGRIQVTPGTRATIATIAPEIVRDPTDLPSPIRARPPSTWRRSSSKGSWTTRPPTISGHSTARYRAPSSACASATRSRSISKTTRPASCTTRSISMPPPVRAAAPNSPRPSRDRRRWSRSKRLFRVCSFITAPRRACPITSPTACMD